MFRMVYVTVTLFAESNAVTGNSKMVANSNLTHVKTNCKQTHSYGSSHRICIEFHPFHLRLYFFLICIHCVSNMEFKCDDSIVSPQQTPAQCSAVIWLYTCQCRTSCVNLKYDDTAFHDEFIFENNFESLVRIKHISTVTFSRTIRTHFHTKSSSQVLPPQVNVTFNILALCPSGIFVCACMRIWSIFQQFYFHSCQSTVMIW